jgi:NADH-quinone oxidoreductase subunit A
MENPEIDNFGAVFLFMAGGVIFIAVTLAVSRLLAPHKPNLEKTTSYECGEDPASSSWGQFNNRFYVLGLVFLLFEAELVFLFPWSVVFTGSQLTELVAWHWYVGTEMLIFVVILAVGLAYVWAKGYLDWAKPSPKPPLPIRQRKMGGKALEEYRKFN